MHVVGLDIGGANLKAATSGGQALSRNFELWRAPRRLAEMLSELLCQLPAPAALAVTMTAELADCFTTKAEGVDAILHAVERVAGTAPVLVWQTSGAFVGPEQARRQPLQTAAANWHALATWAGRFAWDGAALLVDIGSTTSDIIPLWRGVPVSRGNTDSTRLMAGELAYTGVRRTPLCAVADAVPFRGQSCPLAAEVFATTLDVYLTLGKICEDAVDTNTANGRPATISTARDRLARMLCCDCSEFSAEDAESMARFLAAAQRGKLCAALESVLASLPGPCTVAIVSGSGSFLAEEVLKQHPATNGCRMEWLATRFSPALAEAACAYAVAVLAMERCLEPIPTFGR